MGCLNKKLPVDIVVMKNTLLKELDFIMENELEYLNDLDENKKDKLKKNVLKRFKNQINTDYFNYRIINENHCTYKHTRGKNEGYICCKNITNNGNRKKYICRIHNKEHVPKKKLSNLNNRSTDANEKNISDNIEIIHNNKLNNKIVNINKYKDKRNIKKNNEFFRNKKMIINNFNINTFKKIVNNYNHYNNSKYIYNKHNITLLDFVPKNILSY